MANDPVNALTAACPECGHERQQHYFRGICWGCYSDDPIHGCDLNPDDVLRRLADPTNPTVAIAINGDDTLYVQTDMGLLPVVASDEDDRRG